jgi:hypothetical protein
MEVLHINNLPIEHKRGCPVTRDVIDKMFTPQEIEQYNLKEAFLWDELCDLDTFINKASKLTRTDPKRLWKMVSHRVIVPGYMHLVPHQTPSGINYGKPLRERKRTRSTSKIVNPPVVVAHLPPPPVPIVEEEEEELVVVVPPQPREPPEVDLFSRYTNVINCISSAIINLDRVNDANYLKTLLSVQLKYVKLLDDLTPPVGQLYSVSQRAEKLGLPVDRSTLGHVGKRARQLYLELYNGKEPSKRMIDVGSKHVPMNVYNDEEAKLTLDVAILEAQAFDEEL